MTGCSHSRALSPCVNGRGGKARFLYTLAWKNEGKLSGFALALNGKSEYNPYVSKRGFC